MSKPFEVLLAPEKLWQAINPLAIDLAGAHFGLIEIDLGETSAPKLEREILDDVGSYGKQLGHIGDALEVLLRHCNMEDFDSADQDKISILRGDLASIRQIKQQNEAKDVSAG